MNWFSRRGKEASTWGGLSLAAVALGQSFKINEAPAVADTVGMVGQAVMGGAPWWQAVLMGAGGLLMAFKSDGDKGW